VAARPDLNHVAFDLRQIEVYALAPTPPTVSNGSGRVEHYRQFGHSQRTTRFHGHRRDRGVRLLGYDRPAVQPPSAGITSRTSGNPRRESLSTTVAGLSPVTTYYYRFYASNSVGPAWATPAASSRQSAPPLSTTAAGQAISLAAGARLNGNLTAGGYADVTVYWGTTDGGTTASSWQHASSLGAFNEGSFWYDLGGLTPTTQYYYRYYASNASGPAGQIRRLVS